MSVKYTSFEAFPNKGYLIIFLIKVSATVIKKTIINTNRINPINTFNDMLFSPVSKNCFTTKVIKAVTKIIPTVPTDFTKLSYILF